MASLGDRQKSTAITTWIAVVIAAFVCALLIVRAMRSGDAPRVNADAGEIQNVAADPPTRALGISETLAVSRCTVVAPATLLADAPSASSFAIGDALLDARGVAALGIAKSSDAGRTATVVAFHASRAGKPEVTFVDLGALAGDDPPPKPFLLKGNVYAARIETTREKRRLVVQSAIAAAVDALSPSLKEVASAEETRDESLAFDVSGHDDHAFVVWDDDDRGRGVVRLARLDAAGTMGTITIVSPASSDAEAPRVLADDRGGAFVAWVARKVEGDAGGYAVERGAEEPESRWVEIAYVDAQGAVSLPARLAPARASGFDLMHDGAGALVLVRDEEGAVDARGAKLVRQSARGGGSSAAPALDAPTIVLRDGVGGMEPMLMPDPSGALVAYGDSAERTRLLPLDCCHGNNRPGTGPGADAGAPSLEMAVEGGRLLASVPLAGAASLAALPGITRASSKSPGAASARIVALAAVSRAAGIEAHILLCER